MRFALTSLFNALYGVMQIVIGSGNRLISGGPSACPITLHKMFTYLISDYYTVRLLTRPGGKGVATVATILPPGLVNAKGLQTAFRNFILFSNEIHSSR